MHIIALIFICLMFALPAQAQSDKATTLSSISSNLPDNSTGLITPLGVRTTLDLMVNSYQQLPLVNAQTGTTYTFQTTDQGNWVTFNNALSQAVTLPQATGSFSHFNVYVKNVGAGVVTITPTVSTIGGASSQVLNQGQGAWITSDTQNYQIFYTVPLSSGALPPASGGTGTTTVFTPGSVVYAGTSGIYQQDNANFFWDATNHRLCIGATSCSQTFTVTGGASDNATLGIKNGNGNTWLQWMTNGANSLVWQYQSTTNVTWNPTGSGGVYWDFQKDQNGATNMRVVNNTTNASTCARYDLASGTSGAFAISQVCDNSAAPYWQLSTGPGILHNYYDGDHIWRTQASANLAHLDSKSHLGFTATAPSVGSCGTSPAITSGSTDTAGEVTMGTGSPTGCVITFANSGYTTAPFCVVTWKINIASMQYAVSTTAITLTQTGTSSNKVNWVCHGN